MKETTEEVKQLEGELLYLLCLYRELRDREGTVSVCRSLGKEIDDLIEKLKRM